MSRLKAFAAQLTADGKITDEEVVLIREQLDKDQRLDLDDVKLLVELYCNVRQRTRLFDDLFFAVLEKVFLEDRQIEPAEEFYLLKMLYSDREIHERERGFLHRLRKSAPQRSASFEALFQTAESRLRDELGLVIN